ncbi:MAG: phosphotransferase [Bradyrhizobium sp.]
MRLPAFADFESFRIWRNDAAKSLPVALDIARSHRLPCGEPHLFATGSNLVVGLDDRLILKIFPSMLGAQFVSERATLSALRGKLGVPIPEIVVEGNATAGPISSSPVFRANWGRWRGRGWRKRRRSACSPKSVLPLPRCSVSAGQADGNRAGLGRIHARPDRRLPRASRPPRTSAKFLDGLDDLLSDAARLIPMHPQPVILTGEYIPENLLLRSRGDDWHLEGLIDFGDVLTGWREYDLLGPSAFMSAGRPGRVRSLFEGFGYSRAKIDFELKRRLMALLLLHRASDPVRHIRIENWQDKADDLVQLQELIWPTEL